MKITRKKLRELILNEIAQIDTNKFKTSIHTHKPLFSRGWSKYQKTGAHGFDNPYRIEKADDVTEAMLDDAVKLKDLDIEQARDLLSDAHQISPMLAGELIGVVDRLSDLTGEHDPLFPDWVSSYVNYKLFDEAANNASLRYPDNPEAAAYTDDMFPGMVILYKGMYEEERKSSNLKNVKNITEEIVDVRGGKIDVDPDTEWGEAIKYSAENPNTSVTYYDKEKNLVYHLRGGAIGNQFDGIKCDDADVTWKAKAKWKDSNKKGFFGDYPFLTGKKLKMKPDLTESKVRFSEKQIQQLIHEVLDSYNQ